jgi:hypothetical protein
MMLAADDRADTSGGYGPREQRSAAECEQDRLRRCAG